MGDTAEVLLVLGLIFLIVGGLWMILDDPVERAADRFGVDSSGLQVMYMGWNVLPTAIFLLGIVLAITGAIAGKVSG